MTREEVTTIISQTVDATVSRLMREYNRKADEISKNEAFRQFGRREIEALIRNGLISTRRMGVGRNSKILLSRYEISKAMASYTAL